MQHMRRRGGEERWSTRARNAGIAPVLRRLRKSRVAPALTTPLLTPHPVAMFEPSGEVVADAARGSSTREIATWPRALLFPLRRNTGPPEPEAMFARVWAELATFAQTRSSSHRTWPKSPQTTVAQPRRIDFVQHFSTRARVETPTLAYIFSGVAAVAQLLWEPTEFRRNLPQYDPVSQPSQIQAHS